MRREWRSSTVNKISKIICQIFLCLLGAFFILPFVWMISTAFKTPQQTIAYPPQWIPNPATFRSFIDGYGNGIFGVFFKNSVIITTLCIIGTVLSSSLVAFGFARLNSKLKNFWFVLLLSTMMIPGTVTLIPIYTLYSKIGWINTILPLVVPSFLGVNAFYIFLLRQFFVGIPKELAESAMIDGCSWFKIFYKIFLPNAKPALIVVTLFTFVSTWNDFFGPMIFLIDPNKYTLAVGLNSFKQQYSGAMDMGPLMAMSVLTILPILILFLAAQKYFVQGITTTGLK